MEVVSKMKSQCINPDRISALPQQLIGSILTLLPVRDAVRTCILSKKWQYCWRSMPKLKFTDDMIEVPPYYCLELKKHKLMNIISHALLLHNGPTTLEFACRVGELVMVSECDLMISSLSKGNNVREFIFRSMDGFRYKLPFSFFALQELECIHLKNCSFKPPSTFNGFSKLRKMTLLNVEVSARTLQRFLSGCPLLEDFILGGFDRDFDFVEGNKFTFPDLLLLVPLIKNLAISRYYMKYLCADFMLHKLPISLVHLKRLRLEVCLTERDEMSCALWIMRSSPLLEKAIYTMYDAKKLHVSQTPINFLDSEEYSDLNLYHLEILELKIFSKSHLVMEFVKMLMAKSPVLKKVRIKLQNIVTRDEEVKMLRDLVRLSFPRASPFAELIIERPCLS